MLGADSKLYSEFHLYFKFAMLLLNMATNLVSVCVQINADLERSMSEVFVHYDGQTTETKAVDYLQTQVGVIFYCVYLA